MVERAGLVYDTPAVGSGLEKKVIRQVIPSGFVVSLLPLETSEGNQYQD